MTTIRLVPYTGIPDDPFTHWPADVFRRIVALCPSVDREAFRPRWIDHQDVETDDQGTSLYVCHPYNLSDEAWEDFHALTDAGYWINVNGASNHFPGRTVRVVVREPEDGVA